VRELIRRQDEHAKHVNDEAILKNKILALKKLVNQLKEALTDSKGVLVELTSSNEAKDRELKELRGAQFKDVEKEDSTRSPRWPNYEL